MCSTLCTCQVPFSCIQLSKNVTWSNEQSASLVIIVIVFFLNSAGGEYSMKVSQKLIGNWGITFDIDKELWKRKMSSFNSWTSCAKQPTLKLYMTVLICRSSFADHSSKNNWRSIMIILRRQTRGQNISNITSWLVRNVRLKRAISDHKTSLFGRFQFPTNFVFCLQSWIWKPS